MPRRIPLSLELLETFLSVVRHSGDAAEAARQLGINQPSMSKRLKSLQYSGKALQHPWLERSGKTWQLTVEGERVLPAVRELLDRHRQLAEFVASRDREQVRFACGQWATSRIVSQALRQFRGSRPEIPVRISTMRGRERIEGVATGILDFALVSHDPAQVLEVARRPLLMHVLFEESYAAVCRRDSEWSTGVRKMRRSGVSAEQLAALPLILPEPDAGVRQHIDEWFDRSLVADHPPPQATIETGGWETILQFVHAGLGVGIVPAAFLTADRELEVCVLDPQIVPAGVTRLISRPHPHDADRSDLSPPAEELHQMIRRQAEKAN